MIVGIDLGTTNSLVAVWRDGQPELIPNALGQTLTPSVVAWKEPDSLVIGMAARDQLATRPEHTAALFKRYMGSEKKVQLGPHEFLPEELSAILLRALKADAEAALGVPVHEAIITVPAYFSDAQRKATQRAGQLAGLKVERLLNEPTAAALAYGLHDLTQESKFLVFDLGGGTFDVSVLEMFDGVMEVRASAGDNFLGGEDFALAIAKWFAHQHGQKWDELSVADRALLQHAAERGKRQLSARTTADLSVTLANGALWNSTLTEQAFETLVEPLMARISVPIRRSLRDAKLRSEDLDRIVLAGGATRMPLIRRMVARLFGKIPATTIHPDEVVALGAGVQAGLKARDAALRDVVLTDVSPYSLGVEVVERLDAQRVLEGKFLPIIERNTVVPASRVERVYTAEDHQQAIRVRVFQGESREVDQNIALGSLEVPVPRLPEGQPLDIRFTYDINGILEVEATVVKTGVVKRLVIQHSGTTLTEAQLQARLTELAALKVHPREQSAHQALLTWANRLYQERLGEEREQVARLLTAFETVLERQDPRECAEAARQVQQALSALDSDGWS